MNTRNRVTIAAATLLMVVSVVAGVGVAAGASQANEEPVAAFDYSPDEPEPGETITLNASTSRDPDGEIIAYRWDFDNDGEIDAEGGPNRRVAFPSAGTYTVALTVVDNDNATDTTTVDIVVPGDLRPNARLNASANEVATGESVTLDATGSDDPDGRIVEWAFDTDGDGEFEETFNSPAQLQVSYRQAGSREVTLRVTDNDGNTHTATLTLEVVSSSTATTGAGGASTATPAGGAGGASGPASGGVLESLNSRLPGGGMAAGLLIGLVGALVIGGGFVVYRRPDLAGPIGDTAQGPVGSVVLAVVLELLFVGLPIAVIRSVYVTGRGLGTPTGRALFQVAGLALLAVMFLVLALVRFSNERADRVEFAEAMGSLSVGGFQTLVFALAFLASAMLSVGVAALVLALNLGLLARVGAWLVVAGVAVVPLMFALVFVMALRE